MTTTPRAQVLGARSEPAFDYRLRPWQPADRDEVIAFIIGIQRGEFGLPITAADQPDLADIARFYRAGGGEFWVARHGGPAVGTIAALNIGEDTVALRKMFVARDHRGASGLAASLMQTLVGWAEDQCMQAIVLGTTAVMGAAHRFYEKHGFVSIDPRELPASFPRMAVDTRFYRRHLDAVSGETPSAVRGVVDALLARLVETVPTWQHRQALEACAQVLTTTEPLLAELLDIPDASEMFNWLRSLSIIEAGPRGLYPHDIARDTLNAELRWRHPEQYAEIHRRAGVAYRRQFYATPPAEQQQMLLDYVFLKA